MPSYQQIFENNKAWIAQQTSGNADFFAKLNEAEAIGFCKAWDAGLNSAYPRRPDGGAWFPFRRLFIVARKIKN